MPTQNRISFLTRLATDLDNNRSRTYITIALLFYLIPVSLISMLVIDRTLASKFDKVFIGLLWVAIVILPLMLTFGVFIVYRATYSARSYVGTNDTDELPIEQSDEEKQWAIVISKALDWHRFLMPLCLLNMFITLIAGFFLYADIKSVTFGESNNEIIFGSYNLLVVYLPFANGEFTENNTALIPSSIFYLGMLGFMVHFLEMTRRRYVSRNLVPRFYLLSVFRLLQVIIAVAVTYLFLRTIDPSENSFVLVTAFIVGMFPLQLVSPLVEIVRGRLGIATPKELSITLINGIDNTLESLLQEENFDSIQILATTEVSEITKRTAIPEVTLANWQNQARLFNVLGTEVLIQRFARIGINDFDDLGMLATTMGNLPVDSLLFREEFTSAMRVKSDEEAIGTDAFWKVLIQVLIREYNAANKEKAQASDVLGKENSKAPNELNNDKAEDESISQAMSLG